MFRHRTVLLILAAALPILVVLFVNYVVELVPAFVNAPEVHNPEAREIAAGLSADLNQIALLVIGGCAILIRERKGVKASRGFLTYAMLVFSAAVASCFAGFRYRSAMAQQIAYGQFDYDRIANRLAWQMWLLVLALSAFMVLAVIAYFPKHPQPQAGGTKP